MNPDGSDQQRLTFNKTDESSPGWSPDGTQIVFISDRNDAHPIACFPTCNYDLYVMNADGSNQRQLTDTPDIESHPDWSPTGDRITFDADPDGDGKNAIYVINPDGGEPQPLTGGNADDCWGDWSLDAASIVFSSNRDGNYELYIMNADGSNVRRLTHTPDLNETFPDWSPDGTQILFFSYPTRGQRQDIYVMDMDGTNIHQLTDSPRIVDEDPIWSPDGTQIVFQSDRDSNYELYIMNADGSDVRRLTNNRAGDYWPSW
jgi:Tol biopolymer transport system component